MKKIFSIILCVSLCILCVLPVSAAEVMSKENVLEKEELSATLSPNYFSRTLSRLALMNGTATFSSGSISGSAQVSLISLQVRLSSGSSPIIIYMQAPDGTIYSFRITTSGTITSNQFNGCDPLGDWKIWVEPNETIPSITVKIYYDYIYN